MCIHPVPPEERQDFSHRAGVCIHGAYTLHVANLLTSDELDKLTKSVVDKLRPLARVQRETVIRAILEDDDRVRRRRRRGFTPSTTLAMVVRRDGVA